MSFLSNWTSLKRESVLPMAIHFWQKSIHHKQGLENLLVSNNTRLLIICRLLNYEQTNPSVHVLNANSIEEGTGMKNTGLKIPVREKDQIYA